jgi:predicted RNase H-like nuclease
VRSLGIDVGVGKGLDVVLLDERLVPLHVASRVHVPDVRRLIDELRPDVVAIDAPPRWAASGRSRLTERQLASLNISSFNTPSRAHGTGNPFFAWMEVGFEVFAQAAAAGFPPYAAGNARGKALEVFPHASAVVLAGCLAPRGARKHAWRSAVLRAQAYAPSRGSGSPRATRGRA